MRPPDPEALLRSKSDGRPSGTVTFLLTDIEGSTRLWERDREAMRLAVHRHDELVAHHAAEHRGTLLKSRGEGDSTFAVFPNASDAVLAAASLTRSLHAEPWPTASPLRVRMALHTGEADLRDDDYYGPVVNRCARLRSIASGGQVLLSEATSLVAGEHLPPGLALRDLGRHRLRDLERSEHVFQLLDSSVPTDFPPLLSLTVLPNNLPEQLTSFVGREKQLAELRNYALQARMLTIVGPGGVGKTRLAMQLAADLLDLHPDGVWMVDLAPLTDPALIPHAVATALGVREEADRSLEQTVIEHCRNRSMLIVLDNCEHLHTGPARTAGLLLRKCPRVRILATTREALGISGESVWTAPAMTLPPTGDLPTAARLLDYEAVRLFVDRALSARPQFALTEQNAPDVIQICRKLDGVPLAIELAAARVRTLRIEDIAAGLSNYFRLLTDGPVDVEERQQTLVATISWSHDLLAEGERILFRRLSAFAGGWTLKAVGPVCAGGWLLENDDAETLMLRLVDKSLITFDEVTGRYRMLEMIRQYAIRALNEAGEEERARNSHRDYFLQIAEEAYPHLQSGDQKVWLDRLEDEYANLRASLSWSVGPTERLRLAGALHRFWYIRQSLAEGRGWLENALLRSSDAPASVCIRAYNGAGILAWAQGDLEAARRYYEEGLTHCRDLRDEAVISAFLNNLGIVASQLADYTAAGKYYEESLEIFRRRNDQARVANVLGNLGMVNLQQRELVKACGYLEAALTILKAPGNDPQAYADVVQSLAIAERRQGDFSSSTMHLKESLALRTDVGDYRGIALCLTNMAFVASESGDSLRAIRLFGAADALRHRENIELGKVDQQEYEDVLHKLRSEQKPAAFWRAWNWGRTTGIEPITAYAMGTDA